MKKNIAGTFATKILLAAFGFLVLFITTRFMGAEIRGEISMFVLNLTIVVMLHEIVGGPALVYVIPRINFTFLSIVTYIWSALVSAVFPYLLWHFRIVSETYFIHIAALSFLQGINSFHLFTLLGKEKLLHFNGLMIFQSVINVIFLALLVLVFDKIETRSFITALYFSYAVSFFSGFILIRKYFVKPEFTEPLKNLALIYRNGMLSQSANIAHLLSNRFNYYILNLLFGVSLVGIYSTGVALTEAVLMIGASISTVVYARISNSENHYSMGEMAIRLARISFFLCVPVLLFLMLIPNNIYEMIFGNEFGTVKLAVITLSLGVSLINFSTVLLHYFSGTGKYHINAISAFISLVITVFAGYILIPEYGISGAGMAASLAYSASSLYVFIMFYTHAKLPISQFMPAWSDFSSLKSVLIKLKKAVN